MNDEQIRVIIERVLSSMKESDEKEGSKEEKTGADGKRSLQENGKKDTGTGALSDADVIPDIREDDYRLYLGIENPVNGPEFLRIKKKTDARMGLGRSGPRYKTGAYLRMLVDHAGAYDAALSEAPEHLAEEHQM